MNEMANERIRLPHPKSTWLRPIFFAKLHGLGGNIMVQLDRTSANRSFHIFGSKSFLWIFTPCIFISYSHRNVVFFSRIYTFAMMTSTDTHTHVQMHTIFFRFFSSFGIASPLGTGWVGDTFAVWNKGISHTYARTGEKEKCYEQSVEKNRMRLCECRMLQIANSCFRFI